MVMDWISVTDCLISCAGRRYVAASPSARIPERRSSCATIAGMLVASEPQQRKADDAKNSKSILIETLTSGNPTVLTNGLYLKKKRYEVPDDSNLELASPNSSTSTRRSSSSHLMSD